MKIQRFRGVRDYGDRTLHMGGYSEKKEVYRIIKLFLLCILALCLLGAMQTTLFSSVSLFGLLPSPAYPNLCILLVLAAGCIFGEKEGGVCGLLGGITAECLGMDSLFGGIMLLPLIYCILGYTAGVLFVRILAGNLPSFLVFAAVGSLLEAFCRYVLIIIKAGSIPTYVFILHGLFPVWILTVIASPLIYILIYPTKKLFDLKP